MRRRGRSRLGTALGKQDVGGPTVRPSRRSAMQLHPDSCDRKHLPVCWAGQVGGEQEGFPGWEGREGGRISCEMEGAESGGGLPTITIAAGLGFPRGGEQGGRKDGSNPFVKRVQEGSRQRNEGVKR